MKVIRLAISAENARPAAMWARSSRRRISFLPKAEATKNLELRTNALAKNILVDENGQATGVAYIDRKTKQEVEVYGRAVVVAASCVESARIMLNSKSRHWPNGIANSSGQLGRNLCDHLYGDVGARISAAVAGAAELSRPRGGQHDRVDAALAESENPHEEKFIRGYSVYPDGGCTEFPWYSRPISTDSARRSSARSNGAIRHR